MNMMTHGMSLVLLLAASLELAEDVLDEFRRFFSQRKLALVDFHERIQDGNLKQRLGLVAIACWKKTKSMVT